MMARVAVGKEIKLSYQISVRSSVHCAIMTLMVSESAAAAIYGKGGTRNRGETLLHIRPSPYANQLNPLPNKNKNLPVASHLPTTGR